MANYAKMDKKYKEMFDTIDKVRAYLEPIADNICGETGLSSDYSTDNTYYPTTGHFNFYLQGDYFAKISLKMDYNKSTEENIVVEVSLLFNSILKMHTTTSFSKTKVSNKCKIEWERQLQRNIADEKEYKKCMDWLRLLIKQYKILNVKKKKFEIDTDFEE